MTSGNLTQTPDCLYTHSSTGFPNTHSHSSTGSLSTLKHRVPQRYSHLTIYIQTLTFKYSNLSLKHDGCPFTLAQALTHVGLRHESRYMKQHCVSLDATHVNTHSNIAPVQARMKIYIHFSCHLIFSKYCIKLTVNTF